MTRTMYVFLLIFSSGLVLIKPTGGNPLPAPQLIVKSQSNLFSNQPGRQIDLSDILPTEELFWLNLEEGYFACQLNESEKFLKIFRISRLCDYKEDCYKGSDELQKDLRCSTGCDPPCLNGVCLSSRPESQCHCDDGWGGKLCEEPDLNECKYRPCSLFAQCTNTLGSFYCTCRPGYVGDGFECRPEVEKDQSEYDLINEVMGDELAGDPGVRSSICTYNGVEYVEGEEVFTQRRCSDCRCRNGEIRCEKVVCEPTPEGECKAVSRADKCCPDYVCESKETTEGPSAESSTRSEVDLDDSRFDDVIQNVKDLIGGLNRSSIPTSSSVPPTPISILDFVVNGAKKPVTDIKDAPADNIRPEATTETVFISSEVKTTEQTLGKPLADANKTIEVIKNIQNIIGDLDQTKMYNNSAKDESSNDKKVPCEKDCIFNEENAIVYTSTIPTTSTTNQEIMISSEPIAPPTGIPGIVQLSISPSPAQNSSDFEPIVPSQESSIVQTTEDVTSITVTNDEGIKIQDDNVLIEINFPGDYNENREDDVSVKFTFEEENEIDDSAFYENDNTFLYDVVTDSPKPNSFKPPTFDSLPIFEKDIFDPTIYNTFYEENIETDYSSPKTIQVEDNRSDTNDEEIGNVPTEIFQVQRENATSRPEIISNLPVTTLVTTPEITVTENMTTKKTFETTDENVKSLKIEKGEKESNKVPKEISSTNDQEREESKIKNNLYDENPQSSTESALRDLTLAPVFNKDENIIDNLDSMKTATGNNSTFNKSKEEMTNEKVYFPRPAMPRFNLIDNGNLYENEQGSGMKELTTTIWTADSDLKFPENLLTTTKAQFEESTIKEDILDILDTTSETSFITDKGDTQITYVVANTMQKDTTQGITIPMDESNESTPSLIEQLDEEISSSQFDDEQTTVGYEYTIDVEQDTEQYFSTSQPVMINTSTKMGNPEINMKTSTNLNSLTTETGSENGSDSVSSTPDSTHSHEKTTSRPWRVTVTEVESINMTTFAPPTPTKYGNTKESKEIVDKEADENTYSTTSLSEATTEPTATVYFPPTTVTTKGYIQEISKRPTNPTIALDILVDKSNPAQNQDNSTETVTEQFTETYKIESTTKTTMINIDDKLNDISNTHTSKINVGTSPSTKLFVKITTESPEVSQTNNNGAQPRRDDSLFEECLALDLPEEFYSFSGQTPTNIADCSWDFFGCTKKFGTWPNNKACCEDRFSQCSMLVMGKGTPSQGDARVSTYKDKQDAKDLNQSTSNKISSNAKQNPKNNKDLRSKESRLNDEETKVFFIHCIWKYMNCSKDEVISEESCRSQFSMCSDNIVEEKEEDTPALPGVPGVDLPALIQSGNGYASCILVYYNCSDTKIACKKEFNDCVKNLSVKVSVDKNPVSQGSSSTNESGDRYTPNISSGSGKIPEIQCTWSFFQCNKKTETCKREHEDCLNGNIFDNKICAGVAKHPQRYLVPHPTDCRKFYSCQRQGWGGWIANPMDCPVTTGFDKSLMICNYINSLARCKEDTPRSLLSDDLGQGLIAKQTQQQLEVQVGDLGYLSARNITSQCQKLPSINPRSLFYMVITIRLLL